MQLWWRQYAKPSGLLTPKPDYPPVVDTYLTTMLARRLNLRLPEQKQTPLGLRVAPQGAGAEPGDRVAADGHVAGPDSGAEQPGAAGRQGAARVARSAGAGRAHADVGQAGTPQVQIEPIAMRVPAECFYVRFGSFANFLWLQDTLAKWGGDAQNLIALRGWTTA